MQCDESAPAEDAPAESAPFFDGEAGGQLRPSAGREPLPAWLDQMDGGSEPNPVLSPLIDGGLESKPAPSYDGSEPTLVAQSIGASSESRGGGADTDASEKVVLSLVPLPIYSVADVGYETLYKLDVRLKHRSELVERAWKDWSVDFGPPATDKIKWPTSIDGVNSRALLNGHRNRTRFAGLS